MTADQIRKEPPRHLTLRFCPVCGQDDRLKHLRAGGQFPHRGLDGKLCPGEVIDVAYVRSDK